MSKQVRIIALALATIIVTLVALQPLIPVVQERYSELGILGPNMTVGGYPQIVVVNQSFVLYGLISNHEGVVQIYQVLVKLGNQTTTIGNTTYANAPLIKTYAQAIVQGGTWLFPMNLTASRAGANLRFIFELWSYNTSRSSFNYSGIWDQIWVNATLA